MSKSPGMSSGLIREAGIVEVGPGADMPPAMQDFRELNQQTGQGRGRPTNKPTTGKSAAPAADPMKDFNKEEFIKNNAKFHEKLTQRERQLGTSTSLSLADQAELAQVKATIEAYKIVIDPVKQSKDRVAALKLINDSDKALNDPNHAFSKYFKGIEETAAKQKAFEAEKGSAQTAFKEHQTKATAEASSSLAKADGVILGVTAVPVATEATPEKKNKVVGFLKDKYEEQREALKQKAKESGIGIFLPKDAGFNTLSDPNSKEVASLNPEIKERFDAEIKARYERLKEENAKAKTAADKALESAKTDADLAKAKEVVQASITNDASYQDTLNRIANSPADNSIASKLQALQTLRAATGYAPLKDKAGAPDVENTFVLDDNTVRIYTTKAAAEVKSLTEKLADKKKLSPKEDAILKADQAFLEAVEKSNKELTPEAKKSALDIAVIEFHLKRREAEKVK